MQLLNIKLRQVLSKTGTLVGMNIIRAIVAGECDGTKLAGTFYNPRMKSPKAIKATARKIAVIFWNMMNSGAAYGGAAAQEYEQKLQAAQIRMLHRQAARFGMTLQHADG